MCSQHPRTTTSAFCMGFLTSPVSNLLPAMCGWHVACRACLFKVRLCVRRSTGADPVIIAFRISTIWVLWFWTKNHRASLTGPQRSFKFLGIPEKLPEVLHACLSSTIQLILQRKLKMLIRSTTSNRDYW